MLYREFFGGFVELTPRWNRAPAQGAPEREGSGTSADLERPTVLVVDDEADARDFIRTALGEAGYDCIEATSGAEALMLIEQRRPDLLIVDIMMPGMTGIELCSQLRERRDTWQIPIIIYSAYPMQTTHWGLYERSFVKPADVDELLGAVRALVQPSR